MAGYLYSLALKLLYPTTPAILLVLAAVIIGRRRPRWRTSCELLAVGVLAVCGNGWVVGGMIRHLESRHPPPSPVPSADAILVLSGGVLGRTPPRPTIEIADAGDRLLYGATLFKQGKAPRIVCTGNVATGGVAPRPAAEDMAELLTLLGIPSRDVLTEIESENTHEHVVQLCPRLEAEGIGRVLLVTSAMHMPRAAGVFARGCPSISFIPAPTDFRAPDDVPRAWYAQAHRLVPTPRSLLDFSDAAHEYVGLAYYRFRGWL